MFVILETQTALRTLFVICPQLQTELCMHMKSIVAAIKVAIAYKSKAKYRSMVNPPLLF
jgi:hypothetical protein